MTPAEILFWQKAAEDLHIEIVTPFEAVLSDGRKITASALVKNFGARCGMVIDANYSLIDPYAKTLVESGYGYSASFGHSPETYDRQAMIEILADWGWSGEEAMKPAWLI